ncbi:hypothetical protein B0T24DRAFT_115997 [Lasiosphaeria ovina]|uniref:Uncharacterized protein n=1 Tax=Lasiosphaeria ovina TaxID=92902 RepID=A0AAE0MXY6_9PEZI|nr:hypothetical protein B0T24DRAFT_115997 [Lasiosphaeria ovina]
MRSYTLGLGWRLSKISQFLRPGLFLVLPTLVWTDRTYLVLALFSWRRARSSCRYPLSESLHERIRGTYLSSGREARFDGLERMHSSSSRCLPYIKQTRYV